MTEPDGSATPLGRTVIADMVVAKIVGIATREISGVHDLGGGAARVVGRLRDTIPSAKTNLSQGVSVEVGERQAAVDVGIVAYYGTMSIMVNADLVEKVPQSFEDILNGTYKVTVGDVTKANQARNAVLAAALATVTLYINDDVRAQAAQRLQAWFGPEGIEP